MKKTIAFIAALCMVCMSTFAQDKQIFNHLSVGPAVGEGLGVEIAMPIGPQFQIRGGYSYAFPITVALNLSSLANAFGDNSISRDLSNVPVTAGVWKGGVGNIMFDYFFSKKSSFHISAGVLINAGKIASVKADLTKVLRPDEYGTVAIAPKGKDPISSDKNGYAYVDWQSNWKVMPFIGLGWGRPCRQDRLVSVVFDMGLAFTGKSQFQSYNYIKSNVETVVIDGDYIGNKDKGLLDLATNIPLYPMVKLTVFFRCF
ncbi:MAG: hypothetical protein IJP81_03900 [Bacteroidales bacterium]|nr:hypothetical protein [Bacteroidales bacterium]